MSEPNGGGAGLDASGLRERLTQKPDAPQQGLSIETASDTVKALNREEEQNGKSEKDKKTYGRTLDGTGESSLPGLLVKRSFISELASQCYYLRQV